MKFDLKKPCANCPFLRSDKRVDLRRARIKEIHQYMTDAQGASFPCHKTVDYSQDDPTGQESHCAGGIIYSLMQERPNQLTRIALRLRMIDADELLKHSDQVFSSLSEWLKEAADNG